MASTPHSVQKGDWPARDTADVDADGAGGGAGVGAADDATGARLLLPIQVLRAPCVRSPRTTPAAALRILQSVGSASPLRWKFTFSS